jgi:iron complex outermembrane receptor protein
MVMFKAFRVAGVAHAALAFVLASATASVAEAQTTAPDDSSESADETASGNDIIVSAQRRDQRIQDVGIAITAVTGEKLSQLGISSPIAIVAQVPGLQVSGAGGGSTNSFNIRGVTQNAFAGSLESPIAVYNDEAYISLNTAIDLGLFDIDRVEVLRGPQGTLFGRNATGGLVKFVTRRPTSSPDGFLSVEGGTDGRIRVEGGAGGPLSENVAIRLAGVLNKGDGLIKNRIGPSMMQTNNFGLRGQIEIKPSSDVTLLLKAQYLDEDARKGGYVHVVASNGKYVTNPAAKDFFGYRNSSSDPYNQANEFPSYKRTRVVDLTSNLDWEFGDFTLTSVTNYQHVTDAYGEDADMTPVSVYNYEKSSDVDQFSQELRLSYESDSLKGLAGLYYLNIDGFYGTVQTGEVYFGPDPEIASVDQRTQSWAAFAQGDIEFSDTLSLVVGARYSKDKKNFAYTSSNLFSIVAPGRFNLATTFKDDGISAKAQLNYRPNRDWLFYAGINRGIKAGGLNFPLFPYAKALFPFKGETLTAYEAGFKATLAPRTSLNVSAFYYVYDDYQAYSFDGFATRVLNVDARMWGGEAEFQAEPIDGLELNLGGSWLENKVLDVPTAAATTVDTKAAFTPRFTLNGLVRYSWDALGGRPSIQIDGNWKDKVNFNLIPTPVLEEPAFAVFNARVGFATADERWDFGVFVRNVTNKYYRVYAFDTSIDFGSIEDVPGIPRWFGASVAYKW